MKVFDFANANGATLNKSDIQVQTGCSKIGITINAGDGVVMADWDAVHLRLKHVSAKGTTVIMERMPLTTALEIASAREGFFLKSKNILRGTIDITPNGKSLDLAGGYLSLDIDTKELAVKTLSVNTLDAPQTTTIFQYFNPVYINGGVTKEIDLHGVDEIVVPHALAESLQLNFPERSITYTAEELLMIGCDINDIVSIDALGNSAGATFGVNNMVTLPVPTVNRMTVTPSVAYGFYLFLLEKRSVI